MSRYTFTCEHFEYDEFTGDKIGVASKTTTEFQAIDLETMIENFELFLRGAGFNYDGYLSIVNDEEEPEQTENKNVWKWTVGELMKGPITLKDVQDDPDAITITGSSDERYSLDLNIQGAGAMPTFTVMQPEDTISFSLFEDDIPRGKCEICGLDKQMMMLHNCYETKCPVHAPKS